MFNWKYNTISEHSKVTFKFEKLKGDQIVASVQCEDIFDLVGSAEYLSDASINDSSESLRILTKTHFETQQPNLVKFGFAIFLISSLAKALIASVSTIFCFLAYLR